MSPSFAGQDTNDGPATITQMVEADAVNRDGNTAYPLKHDGAVRTNLPTLAADLQKQGVAANRVTARDASGFTYDGTITLPLR